MTSRPWRLVPAGVTLRAQIDDRWPGRDKASDGSVGDAAHQSRPSDHNPDADGWVHAIDVDADLGEPGAMRRLADQLAECARTGRDGGRIKNLVFDDQVASGTYPDTFWTWRGSGYGHREHLHVSFTDRAETDGSPFPLPLFLPEPVPEPLPDPDPPVTDPAVEDEHMIIIRNVTTRDTSVVSGSLVTQLTDARSVTQLQKGGVRVVDLPAVDYNRIVAEGR